MSTQNSLNADKLHEEVVKTVSKTLFKKNKVVVNVKGKRVASIEEVYPDLIVYDVYSVKPFVSSETPTAVSEVEVEEEITEELIAKWLPLGNLNVDRIVLVLPEKTRSAANDALKQLGPKFELHFFDNELHIS